MQSVPSRNDSPKSYRNEAGSHVNERMNDPQRGHEYYNAPYDNAERFQQPGLSKYPAEQFFEDSPHSQDHMPHVGTLGSNASSNQHLQQFNYVENSSQQATHSRISSQADHFPVPMTRNQSDATGLHDVTGQTCPPGGRPRVSITIWEDEGSLCFQVEAKQVTVARREDNNMINGTKLLNVAQMSRGKRDGILKNESTRAVIKVGSMHLKGVWIPFDRALELANRYHVIDMLYPLFVRDIKKFLYHPENYARTQAVLAAANHRQAQQDQGAALADGFPTDRPLLERTLSMPMPSERSLSMLTPPSSASTNGDYWTNGSNISVPISDTHARTLSLPGTPATTPPAPGYFAHGVQQSQSYIGSFTEPRPSISGNRYGQQRDMQRSYNHSRNTSMMSYQDEDMSNASSSHSLAPDVYATLPPHVGQNAHNHASLHPQELPQYQQSYPTMNDQRMSYMPELHVSTVPDSRLGPATPGHARNHSRNTSRGSNKIFSTPNLTTQMSRRSLRTPNGSPAKTHNRLSSRDAGNPSIQAGLWVQQQQMMYNTPQQPPRGHTRQASGPLPHIYEETPSCRMAYQLHGQGRLAAPYPQLVDNLNSYTQALTSPVRDPYVVESFTSPLKGKKKRDRVPSDSATYLREDHAFDDRQESVTPPPIARRMDIEESPKRRRSERTGLHSRSGSVF